MGAQRTLGINGLGRIGKLHALGITSGADAFDRIVVNLGRPVGDLAGLRGAVHRQGQYLRRPPPLSVGQAAARDIKVVDEERGLISAYGKELVILREARNPKDIPWRDHGVSLVVECTGAFRDPHAEPDAAKGSLRGHLVAGARVVVQSSPFKSGGGGHAAARRFRSVHQRDQRLRVRPRQAQDCLSGLVHDNGPGAHAAGRSSIAT